MPVAQAPNRAVRARRSPIPKEQYLLTRQHERARTLSVLRAFPPEKSELRPHPRSWSARELAFRLAVSCDHCAAAVTRQLPLPPPRPATPESWGEVVAAYETSSSRLLAVVEGMTAGDLLEPVPFMVGPRAVGEVPRLEVLWMMLFTEIHHRGELAVYLRLSGAAVPPVYGALHVESRA
jgi:uncharacterized damage-inducible protein DinB